MKEGFLSNLDKAQCFGCEACFSICPVNAITMKSDSELFRYPVVDSQLCIDCGLCSKVCPAVHPPVTPKEKQTAFGGYAKDFSIRSDSTSGGAFSVIAKAFCDENYAVFGAVAYGLDVRHEFVTDIREIGKFRKSKYSQSLMNGSYQKVREFLKKGWKVLFSGTPCQIAGLLSFLGGRKENLLTVEVVCEGVPTPYFINSYAAWVEKKEHSKVKSLDYRYKCAKEKNGKLKGKWDFEVMRTDFENGKVRLQDRWCNPFWAIWLRHLMSRPSCYSCPFAKTERNSDITLGDLWGVHLYCPELYGHNSGSSLVVLNTEKGRAVFEKARNDLFGHNLEFRDALKYQSPMRKHIDANEKREDFMLDVTSLEFDKLIKKWASKPDAKLLWSKYVWGNRQKVWLWNLKNKTRGNKC